VSTRIVGTLVAALVAAGGLLWPGGPVSPDAALARDPAGPELFSDCFWTGPRGRDFTGGAHVANNYPDADATYWFAKFTLPEGARLELAGRYPHARYMSLSSYVGRTPVGSVHDSQIDPDPGSTNPFASGARRDGRRRAYSMSVVAAAAPADPAARQPNTFYAGPSPTVALVYRVYVNDDGTDVAGDAPLPSITLVGADGSRTSGGAACAAVNTPDHDLQTTPPITLAQWNALIHTPGLDPAVAPSTRTPFFQRFFNATFNFLGDFRPETRTTLTPPDNGGAYSNADTRYLYAAVNRRFGPLLVIKGKLPTVPETADGERTMGRGQLRYWSICTNGTPVAGRAFDCASDQQLPLRGDRRYTIVVSRPADRPRNALRRCGVQWLDWGTQRESPDDPGYGLLIVRNMLPSPGFAQAAQRITTLGTERTVMGAYFPRPSYGTKAGFQATGCPRRP
jgi:hypothetical protein